MAEAMSREKLGKGRCLYATAVLSCAVVAPSYNWPDQCEIQLCRDNEKFADLFENGFTEYEVMRSPTSHERMMLCRACLFHEAKSWYY